MTIFLYPNADNPRNMQAAFTVAEHLNRLGFDLIADSAMLHLFPVNTVHAKEVRKGNFDMVASIGGDGTMLQAAQIAISCEVPVFGINSGRIGFLSAFSIEDFGQTTKEDFLALEHTRRVLLEVVLESRPDKPYLAVNEAVVTKVNYAKTAEISVFHGKNSLGTLRCDGIIAATPTGSTGYSLSAGGPVLEPSVEAFVVTPICSHALNAHSYVLTDSAPIYIQPVERVKNEVYLSIDGNPICEIDYQDRIIVRKSHRILQLLTHPKRNLYDLLYHEISERR